MRIQLTLEPIDGSREMSAEQLAGVKALLKAVLRQHRLRATMITSPSSPYAPPQRVTASHSLGVCDACDASLLRLGVASHLSK